MVLQTESMKIWTKILKYPKISKILEQQEGGGVIADKFQNRAKNDRNRKTT